MKNADAHIVIETLYLFQEGKLPSAEAAGIRAHVEACPACRSELDLLREFIKVDSGTEVPGRTPELLTRFRERLDREHEPLGRPKPMPTGPDAPRAERRGWGRRTMGAGLLAAAAAMIVLGLFQVFPRSPVEAPGGLYRGEAEDAVSIQVDRADAGWSIRWERSVDESRPTGTVQVLNSAGELVWEHAEAASPFHLNQTEFAGFSEQLLLVQVVFPSPTGETLRSRLIPLTP